MGGSIFISYRRSNAEAWAGRIYDRLLPDIGKSKLFVDVDAMPPGENFVDVIKQKIAEADLVLVLIAPGWANVKDKHNNLRLEQEDDPVRIELATALSLGKSLLPVLCGDAEMPPSSALPGPLKPVVLCNASVLRSDRFDDDMAALRRDIGTALARLDKEKKSVSWDTKEGGQVTGTQMKWLAGIVGGIAAMFVLFKVFGLLDSPSNSFKKYNSETDFFDEWVRKAALEKNGKTREALKLPNGFDGSFIKVVSFTSFEGTLDDRDWWGIVQSGELEQIPS